MAIMRWDPFGELMSMQREMDGLVRRLGLGGGASGSSSPAAWMPRIDVKADGDDIVVYAEVPGLDKDDIDVSVTGGVLTIKGERKAESEKAQGGWMIRERSYGSFERSIVLPDAVNVETIRADYKDGVLEVHVPKAAETLKPKTHRIALRSDNK